jgi:hypothetical protein
MSLYVTTVNCIKRIRGTTLLEHSPVATRGNAFDERVLKNNIVF